MNVYVGKKNKHEKIDALIGNIRFTGLAYLMDKDFGKLSIEQIDKESKKLALELKVLSDRILSIAFDETTTHGGCNERTANKQ